MKCFAAYTQQQTVNGYEGGNIILICTKTIKNVTRTKWNGPPEAKTYFIDNEKNRDVIRGERLSVILNSDSNAYDLKISNLNRSVDRGNYICIASATPTGYTSYFFLEVYSKYLIIHIFGSPNLVTLDLLQLVSVRRHRVITFDYF